MGYIRNKLPIPAKGCRSWIMTSATCSLVAKLFAVITSAGIFTLGAEIWFGVTVSFMAFFRDPIRTKIKFSKSARKNQGAREIPQNHSNLMIAPADGKITRIQDNKVSIFMNLHNVHVNRSPIKGQVTDIQYRKGGYIPAFMKDSERNERNIITLSTEFGECDVTQISGTMFRRIVPYIKIGDEIFMGQRIGMIRFGSRVDVTIPDGFDRIVQYGDKVRAGETIIAERSERVERAERR